MQVTFIEIQQKNFKSKQILIVKQNFNIQVQDKL